MATYQSVHSEISIYTLKYLKLLNKEVTLVDNVEDLLPANPFKEMLEICLPHIENNNDHNEEFQKSVIQTYFTDQITNLCSHDYRGRHHMVDLKENYSKKTSFKKDLCNEGGERKQNFEVFSQQSRCFEVKYTGKVHDSFCLKVVKIEDKKITLSMNQLISEREIECDYQSDEEKEVLISNHYVLTCPDYDDFKQKFEITESCQNNCNNNGYCVNKKCKCFKNYSGNFCEIQSELNFKYRDRLPLKYMRI